MRVASTSLSSALRRGLATLARPHAVRAPFQQPNRRRDDALVPRMPAVVPETSAPFVQAWLSAWEAPRAGIALLRADVWAMPLRPDVVHRVVTWQRACMRQGTSTTKGRHEVRGGGKKPRPQKGSGRSRQGSIRSPLYVGGGHAHPKVPRDWSYTLNLKVQTLGLKTALSDKYRRGALIVLRDGALAGDARRGPQALGAELSDKLGALGVDLQKQRVMMLVGGDSAGGAAAAAAAAGGPASSELRALTLASGSLDGVLVRTARDANVLDLVKHTILLVTLDALEALHGRFLNERTVGHVARGLAPGDGARNVAVRAAAQQQQQQQQPASQR